MRDRSFGVPHVYGRDRTGAMFGLGYAGAEDRLFFMDILRHAGRARLSSFVGGAAGNRAMDADQWTIAPHTETDLTRQYEQFDDIYGEQGRVVQRDVQAYVAGVNRYIAEARLDPTKLPGEYAATLRPGGPEPWRVEDVIATASLVGGVFGKGGGREIRQGKLLRLFEKRFGERRSERLWREWSAYEDPDAPTTLDDARFPYQVPSDNPPDDAVALWDEGTLRSVPGRARPPRARPRAVRPRASSARGGCWRRVGACPTRCSSTAHGHRTDGRWPSSAPRRATSHRSSSWSRMSMRRRARRARPSTPAGRRSRA